MIHKTDALFSVDHSGIERLLEVDHRIADLRAVSGLLEWDQETYMPAGAVEARGEQLATLAGLSHHILTSKKTGNLLDALHKETKRGEFTIHDQALIRESSRAYDRSVKVPRKLVEELAKAASTGVECWRQARKKSKFSLFKNALAKIFELKLKEAECIGYNNPYDLFLDDHEPGLTTAKLNPIFAELKETTLQILERIRGSDRQIDQEILQREAHTEGLKEFSAKVLQAMGFDFNCGRLDSSTHPFSTGIHPTDTRITTHFNQQFFTSPVFSAIHEAGHALNEQGIDTRLQRTLLCRGASHGIHESQSRFWENYIGRSAPFWQNNFYRTLLDIFPGLLEYWEEQNFMLAINAVEPNLIRVNSDEITYNLHIILRFEIERDLFAGRLKIADLPEAWNAKIKEYLGLTVPDDARGVLQDIHWSSGGFGYFPTYSLGNLYAAQIYAAAKHDLDNFEERIKLGDMNFLREWLRESIHKHGKTYQADELIEMATGEGLNPAHFKNYIFEKFGQIYGF